MLSKLGQQAETQGLKFEAVQSSLDLAEAQMNTRALPQARAQLERALTRSEKLSLRSLQIRGEYLLATNFRLGGNPSQAANHYAESRRLLDDMGKEVGSDKVLQRADFTAIASDVKRWSPPKS